jgi:hypothetical protein
MWRTTTRQGVRLACLDHGGDGPPAALGLTPAVGPASHSGAHTAFLLAARRPSSSGRWSWPRPA